MSERITSQIRSCFGARRHGAFDPLLVTRFLEWSARQFPDKEAVVCPHGGVRLTYENFYKRANKLSNVLFEQFGLRKLDRVAFLEFNCHRLLEAYFGVPRAGGILLPLNIRLHPSEIAYIIKNAEVKFLFVNGELAHIIEPYLDQLKSVKKIVLMGEKETRLKGDPYEALVTHASRESPELSYDINENDVCELFYTSGSTGVPKGVMMTHRELYLHALYTTISCNFKESDRMVHTIPLFHAAGWGTPQSLTAVAGTHVMFKRFDVQQWFEIVEKERVTKSLMVPTMARMLLTRSDYCKYDLSSLEYLMIGGAPNDPKLVKGVEEKLKVKCISAYGLTEATAYLTACIIGDSRQPLISSLKDGPQEKKWEMQAKTGWPVVGVDIRVVNENGEDIRRNGKEIGEIVARSNVNCFGYWKMPKETVQLIDEDGWLHTGDMAVVDEYGCIRIVDRKKDIIISGGENIASVEVELMILSHPAVHECAVIGVPHEKWGETPKAIVVLREGYSLTEKELTDYLRQKLAHFKVPTSVEFVKELPKTSVGKIAKRVLREKYWKGLERRVA